jgi:hypothetical protein
VGLELDRGSAVEARRVEPDHVDTPLDEEVCRGHPDPREAQPVDRPASGGAQVRLEVRIVATEAGQDQDDRARLDPPVARLVALDVLGSQEVVAVTAALLAHVDDARRTHELLQRNLRRRPAAVGEVDRRVDVRPPVLGGAEVVGRVPPASLVVAEGDAVQLESACGGPVDRVVVEGVGEVDDPALVETAACGGRCLDDQGRRAAAEHEKAGQGDAHGVHSVSGGVYATA